MSKLAANLLSAPVLRGARVLAALDSGPVSDSWLLQLDGKKVVLRHDKTIAASLCLDREAEWAVMSSACEAGFAPQPLWRDHERGLLLKEYCEAKVWRQEDLNSPGVLRELGRRLRQLHSSGIDAKPIDIDANIAAYTRQTTLAETRRFALEAVSLARSLRFGSDAVLCHNDLGSSNIVGTEPLIFLDWEYAGLGSPWFDIAGVCCQNELSALQIRELLAGYSGLLSINYEEWLPQACRLFNLISALWYFSVSAGPYARPADRSILKALLAKLESRG